MCPSTLLALMVKSPSSMTSLSPLLLFIFPVFFFFILLFPTCQVRVVRFYVSCPPPSSLLLLLVLLLAGPHLPALDRSGPRRTWSASPWSQWASPGPNCYRPIAVGLPGLNRRESERSGPRRNSNGEIQSAVGLAGPQPARFGALWTTGEILRAAGLAGPQPDLTGQKQSHIECQRECQREC